MLLNFDQKNAIVGHLVAAENWKNLFDINFFTQRDIRLGNEKNILCDPKVFIFKNDIGNKAAIEQNITGAKLYFEHTGDGVITFHDEHNRKGFITASGLNAEEGVVEKLAVVHDAHMHAIPYMGVFVHFGANGEKTICCEKTQTQVTMPSPSVPPKTPLSFSQYFHVIALNEELAGALAMPVYSLMNATKLVLSRDLNVDPDLRAINVLDERAMEAAIADFVIDRFDPKYQGPKQWRRPLKNKMPKAETMQKAWNDSTQFDARGAIAFSSAFMVQRDDNGFRLRTSLNWREAIWAQGRVMNAVIYSDPVTFVRDGAEIPTLLHLLRTGKTVYDHRGGEWKSVLIKHRMACVLARRMRQAARDQFNLQAGEFIAIHHDQGHCVLAMRATDLELASAKLAQATELSAKVSRLSLAQ